MNNFEYEQALKKRNLAENDIKALDTYQKIVDAVDMSEGRMNAVEGVEAILVGIQKFSKITRDSIGAKQDTIEVVEVNRLITEINNLGEFDRSKNYLIFSGIGNHLSFKKTLEKNNFKISKEIVFPDHYQYSKNEIEKILSHAEENKTEIITTYKDFVKISNFGFNKIKFINVDLKIKDESNFINFLKKKIDEKL